MQPPDYIAQIAAWFQYHLLQGENPIDLINQAPTEYPGISQESLDQAYQLAVGGIESAANITGLDPDQPLSEALTGPQAGATEVLIRVIAEFRDDFGNSIFRTIDVQESTTALPSQVELDIALQIADIAGRYEQRLFAFDIVPSVMI